MKDSCTTRERRLSIHDSVAKRLCILSRIQTHVSKSIRVEEETHAVLAALKGDDETFDDVLMRLVEDRRESVREGAGLWAGTDAAESARRARKEMKRGVGTR